MNIKFKFAQIALLVLTTSLSLSSAAAEPGFLVGLMLGPGRTAKPKDDTTTTSTNSRSQIGARLYIGYQFNNYTGIESGLTYFSTVNKQDSEGDEPKPSGNKSRGSFDITAKGMVPMTPYFDLFGKLGMAATNSSKTGAINSNIDGTCNQTIGNVTFCPTASIGLSYNINQSVVADLSANRIIFSGSSSVKYQDFYAIGISYHIVDVYCGQFLC
tara:strand:+ start:2553 stop:3194 length:642 start_codon:yes stop_codon:yes gene_type:complete